jgi:hypothetical protein
MITKKALIAKLEAMNKGEILVSLNAYRNSHPLCATPLQKTLAQLVGATAIEARSYTNKSGAQKTSPAWLITAYRKLAQLIYSGHDINARMIISIIGQ